MVLKFAVAIAIRGGRVAGIAGRLGINLPGTRRTAISRLAELGNNGSPDNADDAIDVARWGIAHGYLTHWTCAMLLEIVR